MSCTWIDDERAPGGAGWPSPSPSAAALPPLDEGLMVSTLAVEMAADDLERAVGRPTHWPPEAYRDHNFEPPSCPRGRIRRG